MSKLGSQFWRVLVEGSVLPLRRLYRRGLGWRGLGWDLCGADGVPFGLAESWVVWPPESVAAKQLHVVSSLLPRKHRRRMWAAMMATPSNPTWRPSAARTRAVGSHSSPWSRKNVLRERRQNARSSWLRRQASRLQRVTKARFLPPRRRSVPRGRIRLAYTRET